MIDECWKDGAKTYIKHDPSFKDIPGFEERRFVPPKRASSKSMVLMSQVPSEG